MSDKIIEKDGSYTAKIVCWGYVKDKKGNDQFAIEFDIDEHGEEYAPTRFTHFQNLSTDTGQDILEKQLRACGWVGDDWGDVQLNVDLKVRVKVLNDDYGTKIKYIDPLSGGGIIDRKRMGERDQAALVARLNARAKSRPASGGTPAPTQSRPVPAQAQAAKPAAPRPAQAKPPAPKQPAAAPSADENSDWGFGSEGGSEGIPF